MDSRDTEKLLAIKREFLALQQEVDGFVAWASNRFASGGSANVNVKWGHQIDAVQEQMFALARSASHLRASSPDAMRVKAELLLAYIDLQSGDILDLLAASLCRDLLEAASLPQS